MLSRGCSITLVSTNIPFSWLFGTAIPTSPNTYILIIMVCPPWSMGDFTSEVGQTVHIQYPQW